MTTNGRADGARTMKASEFKARCLKLMDDVAETGEEIVITKHGKPTASWLPTGPHRSPGSGRTMGKSRYSATSSPPWTTSGKLIPALTECSTRDTDGHSRTALVQKGHGTNRAEVPRADRADIERV